MEKQLMLFDKPHSEYQALWESMEKLKVSQDKVRKRLFYEVKELQAQVIEVRAENQRLKFHTETKSTIRWTA